MRLLIATDAWTPQINGVVRSLEQTARALRGLGVATTYLTPQDFRTVPLPNYPEIRLALATAAAAGLHLDGGRFDAIHIATEGPIGLAVRRACLRRGLSFTTSYHTRFPEYLRARAPMPLAWSYGWLRWFHAASAAVMVSTPALRRELAGRGFERLALWTRGVDAELFRPRETGLLDLPRPIFLFVGRLAVEKTIPDFLGLDLPGTKVVVGDGPDRERLRARFPDAVFMGLRTGEDLARIYASADSFVFPSRTDTFGIVLLEALASGVPVASYPGDGLTDVVAGEPVAAMNHDLAAAAMMSLDLDRSRCRAFALDRSWESSARQFLANLESAASSPERGGRHASAEDPRLRTAHRGRLNV